MLINMSLGTWRPDMPDYNNPGVSKAYNVTPTFGSSQGSVTYQPLLNSTLYSSTTMASRPLGTAIGKDTLGNAKVYGGCATALYHINPAGRAWANISRTGGYTTADGERWEHTEYGNGIYMTNYSNEPQYINKDIDVQFANLTGLFKSRHIATVKDYIVMGNTFDSLDGTVPFRVRWSGLGLPTAWDYSQTTGADFQDIYGYGAVQGIVGGEAGYLLMADGIVKMSYVGYPYWFDFAPVPKAKGCAVAQSIITVEGTTYFIANDGFYAMDGETGTTSPVGAGRIDNFFLRTADTTQYLNMTVAADPRDKLIYWSYVSADAQAGIPDKMLIFNYVTGDWTQADAVADYLFNSLSLPWTLELLDTYASLENIPASLDSPIWAGGNALLWSMKTDGSIYVFGGDTLPATIETQEQLLSDAIRQVDPKQQGDRSAVKAVRPLFDGLGGTASVSIGSRSLPNGNVTWSAARALSPNTGMATFHQSNRYHRFRINLTGSWDNVYGYQYDALTMGLR